MMENAKVMTVDMADRFEYVTRIKEASREADCECPLYMEE